MWSEYRKNANFRSISEFSQLWRVILIPCGRRRRRQRRRRKEYIVDWFIGIHARTGLGGGGNFIEWKSDGGREFMCAGNVCVRRGYTNIYCSTLRKSRGVSRFTVRRSSGIVLRGDDDKTHSTTIIRRPREVENGWRPLWNCLVIRRDDCQGRVSHLTWIARNGAPHLLPSLQGTWNIFPRNSVISLFPSLTVRFLAR